ncbi:hypothetical protein TNCV_4297961 [Trichonephila clavipes]|nr:hypothetical protein TNCV_4297961 [Trichonephila clavipes]
MAYLGKARKEDLRHLAEELNLNVGDNMKIADLIEDRKLREQQEVVRKQQGLVREQQEFEKEKKRLDHEFQLEKLRLKNERLKGLTSTPEAKGRERVSIEKRHWVSALLALLPSEINQLKAREAEEKFDDYDYTKDLLLKR